jgi:putative transposase
MNRSRSSDEQIIGVLREAGMKAAEVCRNHGISEPTFLRLEGEVRWHERAGCRASAAARGRERETEEGAGGAVLDNAEGRRTMPIMLSAGMTATVTIMDALAGEADVHRQSDARRGSDAARECDPAAHARTTRHDAIIHY